VCVCVSVYPHPLALASLYLCNERQPNRDGRDEDQAHALNQKPIMQAAR
jgi:hypothetical protein